MELEQRVFTGPWYDVSRRDCDVIKSKGNLT